MNQKQMSDTVLIGMLLALIGGFLDAYTYICRGAVFANAQTGNIVLFGIQLIEGEFLHALYYVVPIFAFSLGIFMSEMIRNRFLKHPHIHWRQMILGIEMIILFGTAFIPQGHYNMFCNILISFVCALQVESFRKFNGHPYASTMCTGNLRSATEYLYQYFQTKEKKTLTKSLQYDLIIFIFICGACLGTFVTSTLTTYALLIPVLLLCLIIIFMSKEQV